MKKLLSMITAAVMLICAVCIAPTSAVAEDTLTISTAADFKAFADSVNGGNTYEGKTVTLAEDIDISGICGENINGEEISWTPIGDFENPFNGTFDGAGHTVSGLYIHSDYMASAGLFNICNENSQILNLVVDGSITLGTPSSGGGASAPIIIGGIASLSMGKIVNCHNKVTVTGMGNGSYAAGICGMGVNIENCVNTGVITSEWESEAMTTSMGNDSGNKNCYYLEGTSDNGSNATAKTAEQFASGEVAYLLGDAWGQRIGVDEYPVIGGDKVYLVDGKYMNVPDSRYGRIAGKCHPAGATLKLYKGTNDAIAETIADSNGNYAFENLEPGNNYAISCDKTGYLPTRLEKLVVIAGETTEANISTSVGDSTIVISNAQELKDFADRVNSGKIYTAYKYDIVLENDIDLSEICGEDINGESVSWIPIGTPEHPFTGYFNGDNHTISGLYIDWEASNADELTNYRGLFGYAGAGSSIYDLTLEGTVNGGGAIFLRPPASSKFLYIGSIAGYSEGNLINCHNNAKVAYRGNYGCAGGIIGAVSGDGAYVKDCSNIADVEKSFDNCGGIAGNVENHASVIDCWCACESMIGAFGGIDTENGVSVEDCYYLAETDDGAGGKTAEQFASGEVAYLLGSPWGQEIGVDEYPVYDGDAVYLVDGKYTNEPLKYPYTINSLKLVSASGEEYGEIPTGTSFIVDMDVTKIADWSGQAYFIVAAYGENGGLVSLNYIKADLPTGTSFSCGVNIPKTDELIETVKAFVWDGFGTMTPLAENRIFTYDDPYEGDEFETDEIIVGIYDDDSVSDDFCGYYLDYFNKTLPELNLRECRFLFSSGNPQYDNGRKYRTCILTLNNGSRKRVIDAIRKLSELDVVLYAQPNYIYYPD